jgi:hypothetical protein
MTAAFIFIPPESKKPFLLRNQSIPRAEKLSPSPP